MLGLRVTSFSRRMASVCSFRRALRTGSLVPPASKAKPASKAIQPAKQASQPAKQASQPAS